MRLTTMLNGIAAPATTPCAANQEEQASSAAFPVRSSCPVSLSLSFCLSASMSLCPSVPLSRVVTSLSCPAASPPPRGGKERRRQPVTRIRPTPAMTAPALEAGAASPQPPAARTGEGPRARDAPCRSPLPRFTPEPAGSGPRRGIVGWPRSRPARTLRIRRAVGPARWPGRRC